MKPTYNLEMLVKEMMASDIKNTVPPGPVAVKANGMLMQEKSKRLLAEFFIYE